MTNPTADAIKALRAQSGLSQPAFGALIGASLRTVQDWEAERRNCPQSKYDLLVIRLATEPIKGLRE